jgi:hypothetical protein
MGFMNWANSKVKNLDWIDVQMIKLSAFSFALLLAKLWEPILSLEWYWYGTILVLAAIKPMYDISGK